MPSRSDVYSGAAAASSSDASSSQHSQQPPQQQTLQSQVFVPSSHAGEDNMVAAGYLSSSLPPNADQNSNRSVGYVSPSRRPDLFLSCLSNKKSLLFKFSFQ